MKTAKSILIPIFISVAIILFLILALIFEKIYLYHEYKPKTNTTYITKDESVYFFLEPSGHRRGKLRTINNKIYMIEISVRELHLEIIADNQSHERYYTGGAEYKKNKIIFSIDSRVNDICPELPDVVVFYKHEGQIVPEWAE